MTTKQLQRPVGVKKPRPFRAGRTSHQEKLNQGLIDSRGEALVTFEDLALTLQTQLKRQLPASTTDRMSLLAELRKHRLLRYAPTFTIANEDAYLAIRSTILGVVSNEALAVVRDADAEGVSEPEATPIEEQKSEESPV